MPNVQWRTPDDGQRNCPKHVEFLDKNKFGELVRVLVTMQHGNVNVKKIWLVVHNALAELFCFFYNFVKDTNLYVSCSGVDISATEKCPRPCRRRSLSLASL